MLTRRHVEAATGLFLAGLGVLVAYGAWENGVGWTDFGPAAGYFPFRIGLLMVALGLGIALRYGLARHRASPALETKAAAAHVVHQTEGMDERFFEHGALGRIASVFVPTAVAAALIPWLGMYFAGSLFLLFSIVTLGRTGVLKAFAIAAGTMAAFFVLFEYWFQVPLAKGIVMPLLGIY